MNARMDLLWIFPEMYTPQTTGRAQTCLCFFFGRGGGCGRVGGDLNDEISRVSMSRELYIILNWLTFQNDQKTHLSISVYHNIYIKDQRKWAKMRFSGLIKGEFTLIYS